MKKINLSTISTAQGLLLLILLATLVSCGGGGGGGSGASALEQPPASFYDFVDDCEQNVDAWQRGQTVFPSSLSVEMDESVLYRAGIDISGGADLQARLLPDEYVAFSTVEVDVRCGLGARLVSGNSAVEVDQTEWVMRAFDRPGTLEWSWNVRGKKPGNYDLRLELRPAVAVVDGGYVIPAGDNTSSPVTALRTDVTVTATVMQHLYLWWDANWGKLVAIASALGIAVLAVRTWVIKLMRRDDQESAPPDPPGPPAPTPGAGTQ